MTRIRRFASPQFVLICLIGLVFSTIPIAHLFAAHPPDDDGPRIDVLFSPGGRCTDRIVQEIAAARKRVRVQAFIFTSKEVAGALIAAKKRGVACEVMVDKSQEKQTYGRLPVLNRAGVKIRIDGEHATANNKVILIDEHTVITGSFNYTKAAEEKNAENILIIRGHEDVFEAFNRNYDAHREHSTAYRR